MEDCQLQHLWNDFVFSLYRFNALSQPTRQGEKDISQTRPLFHLFLDRRNLYAIHPGHPSRWLGLDHIRYYLGIGNSWDLAGSFTAGEKSNPFGRYICGDGLAAHGGHQTFAGRLASYWILVASSWRLLVYGGTGVLFSGREVPSFSWDMASVCSRRKHLPLRNHAFFRRLIFLGCKGSDVSIRQVGRFLLSVTTH